MNEDKNGCSKKESEIINIPIEQVKLNQLYRKNKYDEKRLKALTKSIKEIGLLQPILVRKTDDDNDYEVITGERRLVASKLANLKTIPVIVVHMDDNTMTRIYTLDVLSRDDLTLFEEARTYYYAINNLGFSKKEIAAYTGKTILHIDYCFDVFHLPKKVRERMLESDYITFGYIRAILHCSKDENHMLKLIETIFKEKLSIRQAEKLAMQINEENGKNKS